MATKPLIQLIYGDLVEAVNGIGTRIFLDRPKRTSEELSSFIVVDVPTELRGRIAGESDVMVSCYGTFTVFCKAKTDRTLNIVAQSAIVQQVLDVFPIQGSHIIATHPTILMQGEDGHGFQVTQITFKLRTKFNARDIDKSQPTQNDNDYGT